MSLQMLGNGMQLCRELIFHRGGVHVFEISSASNNNMKVPIISKTKFEDLIATELTDL